MLYPVFSIVDFIYANDIFWEFVIIRLIYKHFNICSLHSLFERKKYNYRILLHIALLLISATQAVLCTQVNVEQLNIYFLLYSVILLFFNLLVFWEPVNSVIQTLLAFLLILLFFYFNLLSDYRFRPVC